jgi:hypothetical protein
MADSVLDFYAWTKTELPARAEKQSIVERPVIVEKTIVVKEAAPPNRKLGLSLSPTLCYLLFPWSFSSDLNPIPAAGLEIAWTSRERGRVAFDTGIELQFTTLHNKDRAGVSAIDVVMLPVQAEAGVLWRPVESFGLCLGAAGGFSFLFGRVNSELMNYLRPLISTRIDAEWRASPSLSLYCGAGLYYGFGFYSNQNMLYIAPEISANFRL